VNIQGKVVVITGATSGLGQAAAIDFAKAGARVIVVGRDAARAEETKQQAGGNVEVVLGDVSTRAGVAAAARAILDKAPKIDVLVNNAGGTFKAMAKTADELETTFALNTFGPYLLERALHGAVAAAKGRVVNVVTGFLNRYPVPEIGELVAPTKYSGMAQYARTKHASLMMTVEQARKYQAEGITTVAIHPGIIMGTRFGGGQPKAAQLIAGPIMRAMGIACTLDEAVRRFRVACFEDVPTGSYLVKGTPAPLPKQSTDAAVRGKVVAKLDELAA
jgi:NAD(P)-dependent dehydrogenase (short-subunit alcohol dehydrogenase family)